MTRTLLVVDDDSNVRQLVRRVVRHDLDVTLLEADHGLAAIDILMESAVDLVLLDISMPIMNGLETLGALRRMPQFARLPVMILAGKAEETQVQQLLGLGIIGFLVKPFRPSLLRDRLGMVLARVTPRPALPPRPRIGGLDLDRSGRVLLLDENEEFRRIFARELSDLCGVETTASVTDALELCAAAPYDAIFVGDLHTVVHAELFARKARLATQRHATPVIALPSVAEQEATEALGLYEFTVLRSFMPDALRAELKRVMSPATIARWLLAPAAPGPTAFAEAALERAAHVLAREVTTAPAPPSWAAAQGRWVEAQLEVQANGLSWRLSLELPYTSALRLGEAELGQADDQLADQHLTSAAERLLDRLGAALAAALDGDLRLEFVTPTTAIRVRAASPFTPDGGCMRRWLTWNEGTEGAAITLAPLAPRTAH